MSVFTCFGELPTELRLKVWSYAAHSHPPRVITLYPDPRLQKEHPAPAILHACSESREVGLGVFELSLGNGKNYSSLKRLYVPPGAKDIYVNFDRDIIYLPFLKLEKSIFLASHTLNIYWQGDKAPNVGITKARVFATRIYDSGYVRMEKEVWQCLAEFTNLRELYIINGEHQGNIEEISTTGLMDGPPQDPKDYVDMLRNFVEPSTAAVRNAGALIRLMLSWKEGKNGEPWPTKEWKIVGDLGLPALFSKIMAR